MAKKQVKKQVVKTVKVEQPKIAEPSEEELRKKMLAENPNLRIPR